MIKLKNQANQLRNKKVVRLDICNLVTERPLIKDYQGSGSKMTQYVVKIKKKCSKSRSKGNFEFVLRDWRRGEGSRNLQLVTGGMGGQKVAKIRSRGK